jgi:hypothetical protein
MTEDRIDRLGATVLRVPAANEPPELTARVARLWAEIHEADRELALEIARKLPLMHIKRNSPQDMPAATIALSKRQIGDAQRLGGIELMILWPSTLGREPIDVATGCERAATRAEIVEAKRLLCDMCAQHELVILRVRTARAIRPADLPSPGEHAHLAIILVGHEWAPSTRRNTVKGRTTFAH